MNHEHKNTREQVPAKPGTTAENQRTKTLERLKQITDIDTRRKIIRRMTTGLLAPLSVLAMNAPKAEAAPQLPESFTPEAQRMVEGIRTRKNEAGHIFTIPGVQGEISAEHVTRISEEDSFRQVPGTRDISVENGFDLSQIESWQMPTGQTMDAVLTTSGNVNTGFEAEQFQIECKILGINYADMWAEEDGREAQLVVCARRSGVRYLQR